MAVRQYIGARYVPIFADPIEWNEKATYEALTIVTYLGASYTSRKAVPAGIDPTNNEYWAVTGNYNAQVEEYRQQVEQYKQTVDRFSITAAQIGIHPGDKVLIVSDSFGSNPTNFVQFFKSISKADITNLSEGGAGFGDRGDPYHTFLELLQTDTTPDKSSVKAIIVGGGANDVRFDYTTILNAVNAFCTYATATYPNAIIYVFFAGASYRCVDTETTNNQYKALNTVRPAYQFGVQGLERSMYIEGTEQVFTHLSNISSDNLHPTIQGYKELAQALYSAINNAQSMKYNQPTQIVLKLANQTNDASLTLSIIDNGNFSTIYNSSLVNFTISSSSFPSRSIPFTINTNTSNLNIYRTMYFPISAQFLNAGKYYQGCVLFGIKNSSGVLNFDISHYLINDEHTGYLNLEQVTQVQVHPFTIILPY